MTAWIKVWRDGFAPGISTEGLQRLRTALAEDALDLRQGCTTVPPPLMTVQDWPVEACCPMAYTGWTKGDTVGQVEEYFLRLCTEAGVRVGEESGARYLLCWIDDTPRDVMRAELLAEVDRALEGRASF